jgi:nicotinamide mononucleotide adenylyltransferase
MYNQALIIGRFQPLSFNHILLFDNAKTIGKELLIGIGVPNYARAKEIMSEIEFLEYQIKNIFTFEKTKKAIEKITDAKIVPIKDIFDSSRYANHVIEEFEKKGIKISDCVIVGDNKWTLGCFEEKMKCVSPKINTHVRGTIVREEIFKFGKSENLKMTLSKKDIERIKICQYLLHYKGDLKEKIKELNYKILED